MTHSEVLKNLHPFELNNFSVETLKIESPHLRNNPLKDAFTRYNPLLIPKSKGPWPVVFVLGGFSGNAPFYFNAKFNEQNTIQVLDKACSQGDAPEALYVFVDALSSWGGSQFLNSTAVGNYEDYIVKDIVPALKSLYELSPHTSDWCVMGGSSGGYGALHLASAYPDIFGVIAAIAPDSFFEASLLPDLYQALPFWEKYQSGIRALEDLRNGRLTKNRNWHSLLNAFGMAACYSPKGEHGDFHFPLDSTTGEKNLEIWKLWLTKDPIHFLPQRIENLQKLAAIYLDVGNKDNFNLQYGTRQISHILKNHKIDHDYKEFDGNHFDIGERRSEVWKWLTLCFRR